MARGPGIGSYGNLPSNMFGKGQGTTTPTKPLNPGLSGKASPNNTKAGIVKPIGPGAPRNLAQVDKTMGGVPTESGGFKMRARGIADPVAPSGQQKDKKQPARRGVPGGEKGFAAGKDTLPKKNARISKPAKKNSIIPGGAPLLTPKASKAAGFMYKSGK